MFVNSVQWIGVALVSAVSLVGIIDFAFWLHGRRARAERALTAYSDHRPAQRKAA